MILIGASGHAKVIIDILEKSNITVDKLVDANPVIKSLQGYDVEHDREHQYSKENEYIISIGSNTTRKRIATAIEQNFGWAVHPSAILGDEVEIAKGTVVMAGSVINSTTKIGAHCIINTSASIDHDCIIEDYVHISPNATLCGGITVGEGTQIGAGATVIPNLKIGKWSTIGAGAVIIEDIPDHVTVVGNPGRILNKLNE